MMPHTGFYLVFMKWMGGWHVRFWNGLLESFLLLLGLLSLEQCFCKWGPMHTYLSIVCLLKTGSQASPGPQSWNSQEWAGNRTIFSSMRPDTWWEEAWGLLDQGRPFWLLSPQGFREPLLFLCPHPQAPPPTLGFSQQFLSLHFPPPPVVSLCQLGLFCTPV